jgi:putative aldouronate transport system substrate-binding protein
LAINQEYLEKTGLKFPDTLDEFYQVLKAFKEQDPSGTGKIVPLGGNFRDNDFQFFILQAYGFVTRNAASEPALRNGKVEIPCGSPLYKDFLTFMRKLYSEGLIDENYFTMDRTQVAAQAAELRHGMSIVAGYTNLPNPADFQKYIALSPVTSVYNPIRVCTASDPYVAGTVVMSARTKYPEVAMRYMDYIYTQEGRVYSHNGAPAIKSEDTLGMYRGWYIEGEYAVQYPDVIERKYGSGNDMTFALLGGYGSTMGNRSDIQTDRRTIAGLPYLGQMVYNPNNGDHWMRMWVEKNRLPYVSPGYPNTIYFTEEESIRIMDLKTVISDYVAKESAKFITGANSLANIDKYYNDLNALGFKEYQDLYIKGYDTFLKNLKL